MISLPVQPVLLPTDALLWLIVAVTTVFLWRSRRTPRLVMAFQQLARRPIAVASLVLLLPYMSVALLDSVHFQRSLTDAGGTYHAPVESLLDRLLLPLSERTEKTYSAPLALFSYSKETRAGDDRRLQRTFPRLRHGGAHLSHAQARGADIRQRALPAAGLGLGTGALLAGLVCWRLARRQGIGLATAARRLLAGKTPTAWRSALLTATAFFVLAAVIASLATAYHVLGTDKVGQDVLYLSLKSIRTGVVIGSGSLLIALPLAIVLGTAAGYFGGRVDDLVQYLYSTLNAIPGVLLIAAAVLTLDVYMDQNVAAFANVQQRADLRLTALCLILGATGWIGLCRLLRGEALKLRELEYVQSARALGLKQVHIISRHLWPNLTHLVLLTAVIDFSGLVLAEAVLSYVGVGVDPGTISWGNMINTARLELAREPAVWWSLAAAFVFMLGLVLPANLLADALRDALDPRQRSEH
ncbi:MAG: ABC transporter permease [Immundisolibacter sp.]|uniref:ABC transporter permease n=1 Tax=Immundisolibacter sp. TaxID=1934948 RepID=UPI003EE37D9B